MPTGVFIDIHRHGKGEGRVIVNFDTSEWIGQEHRAGYYSIGIHPWFIERQDCRAALRTLESALADANLLALGECGLDRLTGAPFSEQESIFIAQLELAEQCGKPVVIHCVRAFNELLRIKSTRKSSVSWIVHGFNNKPSIAASLIDHGCYLSFGKVLLHPNSNAAKVLPAVPEDRVFLETDDSGLGIDSIYRAAAAILQIDLPELQQHLENNFNRVFLHD